MKIYQVKEAADKKDWFRVVKAYFIYDHREEELYGELSDEAEQEAVSLPPVDPIQPQLTHSSLPSNLPPIHNRIERNTGLFNNLQIPERNLMADMETTPVMRRIAFRTPEEINQANLEEFDSMDQRPPELAPRRVTSTGPISRTMDETVTEQRVEDFQLDGSTIFRTEPPTHPRRSILQQSEESLNRIEEEDENGVLDSSRF